VPFYAQGSKKVYYYSFYYLQAVFFFCGLGIPALCEELNRTNHWQKNTPYSTMTDDCVQVSSKGSLTGGYFNKSRSRLEIQKIRSEKSEEIREQEEEMRKLRDDLATLEAEINKVSCVAE
jgi:structural maintenance of chromosome 3 (chondroitin sulfate proteoglycan 6)